MIHYEGFGVVLHHGDCVEVMRELPDSSVDAVVTDPPYGLEFMGKEWDSFKPANGKWTHDHTPTLETAKDTPHHRSAVKQPSVLMRCQRCGGNSSGQWNRCECATPDFRQQSWPMRAFQDWCEVWAAECLRVLKPGGHLLAFGGTRTSHRLACAIEDAGFEVRDSIAWLYGSGFPKSQDVSKAIDRAAGAERVPRNGQGDHEGTVDFGMKNRCQDCGKPYFSGNPCACPRQDRVAVTDDAIRWSGWGTALKPGHEPIVMARKPLVGTVAANVLAHGTGALNIDATRIAHVTVNDGNLADNPHLRATINGGNGGKILRSESERREVIPNQAGRWPPNVALDEPAAVALDAQSGARPSTGTNPSVVVVEPAEGVLPYPNKRQGPIYADEGGASRYFKTVEQALDELPVRAFYTAKAGSAERPVVGDARHVTVKPLELMRWLVRLVTPPQGVVLDPFAGSGTTAEACVIEGFSCVVIEKEAEYLPLVEARITRQRDPVAHTRLTKAEGDAPTLFDL